MSYKQTDIPFSSGQGNIIIFYDKLRDEVGIGGRLVTGKLVTIWVFRKDIPKLINELRRVYEDWGHD